MTIIFWGHTPYDHYFEMKKAHDKTCDQWNKDATKSVWQNVADGIELVWCNIQRERSVNVNEERVNRES